MDNSNCNLKYTGKTVGEVKNDFRFLLNIPPNVKAIVNNEKVEDSYILKDGDDLQFSN